MSGLPFQKEVGTRLDQLLLCFFTTFFIVVLIICEITLVKTLTPSKYFVFWCENLSLPNIMTRKMVTKLHNQF